MPNLRTGKSESAKVSNSCLHPCVVTVDHKDCLNSENLKDSNVVHKLELHRRRCLTCQCNVTKQS